MDTMRHKVWREFACRLERMLETELGEDCFLAVIVKDTNRFVQFAGQGAHGMRVEATGNAFLDDGEKLEVPEIMQMLKLGWNSPTGSPTQATPVEDPSGSPNFYVDMETPVPFGVVAELAVRTLREVFGAESPIFLECESTDANGFSLDTRALKLQKAIPAYEKQDPRSYERARLLRLLSEETGTVNLEDDDWCRVKVQVGGCPVRIDLLSEDVIQLHTCFRDSELDASDGRRITRRLRKQFPDVKFDWSDQILTVATNVSKTPFDEPRIREEVARFLVTIQDVAKFWEAEK